MAYVTTMRSAILAINSAFILFAGLSFSPASAGPFDNLHLVYHATFGNGAIDSGVDPLGIGPLKSGSHGVPDSNPTLTPDGGDIVLGVTRPAELVGGLVSSGLFATPVDFGPGSVFGMRATYVAPQGPHGPNTIFAVVLGAKTGDENDNNSDFRAGAALQIRGDGARLNVPGANPPPNLPNLPQKIYDAIFDPVNPRPFTLEFLVDRVAGRGEATFKVDGEVFSQTVQFAVFRPHSGPTITAVGPALAIANGPDQRATVHVRDFKIFTVKQRAATTPGDLCPADFGCRLVP